MQTVSRLITTFIPDHYTLSLVLRRQARTFGGTVVITGSLPDPSGTFMLHSKGLTIASITVNGTAATWQHDGDELTITPSHPYQGALVVTIAYSGTITDTMHGLYPCYYEHDGAQKELLATQFESHHAREVFPCVDEPEAKATFDVTLTTEKDVTVLGNMPVKQQTDEGDALVTSFETSPRMSTYLLAFVVGELHKASATTKGGVEVNVWATPAQPSASLAFGLDIAVRTIDFFDEYFGTPYPLQKSDHVALPDFSSGAMENWGLITYREVALLADPATSSLASKRQAATVIAHELSHQWFGNLVTMKWWNDLWLNESFANLMEYIAIDALHPEWDIWLEYAGYEVLQALRRDSLQGVQSIRTDVNHPDEIGALFDPSIVYAKGGRLLRMLQTYIGTEAFQAGLRTYFKTYAYTNTEANDLWHCFSVASGKDIAGFMNAWVAQSGYPVVTVSSAEDKVRISQQQFFIGPHEPSDKLWPIPLGSTCSEMPDLLNEKQVTVTRHHTTPLYFNQGSTAHFITLYDDELLRQLLETVNDPPAIDRLQLLHEQTLLAQGGVIASASLLNTLGYYADETIEAVWDIMSVAINELKRFVEDDETADKELRAFVGRLATKQYERLGWDAQTDEPEADTKLRSVIIGLMLFAQDPDATSHATRLYSTTDSHDLDPELRTSIMAFAVREAITPTVVSDLMRRHETTSSSELKEEIAAALTSTKDPAVIDQLIGLFKNKSVIRPQDFSHWFVWLLRNRYGRTATWQWARDNWDWIKESFSGGSHYDSFPRYIASSLRSATQLDEFKTFFGPYKDDPALRRNIAVGTSELQGKVALIERDTAAVVDALHRQSSTE